MDILWYRWGKVVPSGLSYRGGFKDVKHWDFNGASLDQGLLTHYFVLGKGNVMLLDTKEVRQYSGEYRFETKRIKSALVCCNGVSSIQCFAHFTGTKKPWLQDGLQSDSQQQQNGKSKRVDESLLQWAKHLDDLNLPINSSNIKSFAYKPPLGYWHPNT